MKHIVLEGLIFNSIVSMPKDQIPHGNLSNLTSRSRKAAGGKENLNTVFCKHVHNMDHEQKNK
jgi:hypothetical protein